MKVGSNSQHAPRGNPAFAKAWGFWQMPFSTPAKETNVTFKRKYLISAFGDLQQISLINRGLPRSVSLLRTRWSPSSAQSIKYDWRKKGFKNFELHPRRKNNYPCASCRGVAVTPRPPVYHATDYSWGCQRGVTEPAPRTYVPPDSLRRRKTNMTYEGPELLTSKLISGSRRRALSCLEKIWKTL